MNQASTAYPHLTLYGRDDCHLCEQMQSELIALQARYDFTYSWVDVDADKPLELKYGFYVPVLMLGEQKLCHYHLDGDVFSRALSDHLKS